MQILDFLTTHPGSGFTLSELSRRLRISKATAHAVLATLTERALLVRNPATNEYRLGPALVPMGAVAERAFPALTHAKHEAERLAQEFDAECVIVVATGDQVLIAGRAGIPRPRSITSHEGQRQPLVPPMGSTVLAWTGDDAIEAWLDRLGPELSEAERNGYRTAVATIRRRGFAVGIHVPDLEALSETYAKVDMYTPEGRREISRVQSAVAHQHYLLGAEDLPPDTELSTVGAPIFGPDGSLLLAIALMLSGEHHVSDIPVLSRAVLRAAGRVMAAIDGRPRDSVDVPAIAAGR